jgi:hypothetical protein
MFTQAGLTNILRRALEDGWDVQAVLNQVTTIWRGENEVMARNEAFSGKPQKRVRIVKDLTFEELGHAKVLSKTGKIGRIVAIQFHRDPDIVIKWDDDKTPDSVVYHQCCDLEVIE